MTGGKVAAILDVGEISQFLPVESLAEALNTVPDPRHARGKRHRLGPVLCMAVCAMLSGSYSITAVAQWGRDQGESIAQALGFKRKPPCVATFQRIFVALDVDQFEAVLGRWFSRQGLPEGEAIAIDGKGLRGIHGEQLPSVHLVAAYAHWKGVVLGQKGGKDQRRGANGSAGTTGGDRPTP